MTQTPSMSFCPPAEASRAKGGTRDRARSGTVVSTRPCFAARFRPGRRSGGSWPRQESSIRTRANVPGSPVSDSNARLAAMEMWQLDGFEYTLFNTDKTTITVYQIVDDSTRYDVGTRPARELSQGCRCTWPIRTASPSQDGSNSRRRRARTNALPSIDLSIPRRPSTPDSRACAHADRRQS